MRAGTTLALESGVDIIARGPVEIRGTREHPVVLEPATTEPWGVFAVTGSRTEGTYFHHLRATGGSTSVVEGQRFKGMINVYGCSRIEISDCWFGPNFIGDDAVNLANSAIVVRDSTWQGARADGLDLDRCRGSVSSCTFLDCGNDGLDLMASDVMIRDCTIVGSGDKGISVGEETKARILTSTLERCDVGVQVKDLSRAQIEDCRFVDNVVGLHSYQKKWRYGRGGSSALIRSTFSGSRLGDLNVEKRCEVWLVHTPVNEVIDGAARVQQGQPLPADWLHGFEGESTP